MVDYYKCKHRWVFLNPKAVKCTKCGLRRLLSQGKAANSNKGIVFSKSNELLPIFIIMSSVIIF